MTTPSDSMRLADHSRFIWLRRLLTTIAVIAALLTLPIVIGALIPNMPIVGEIGALFESFFSLHIFLLACAGVVFGLLARRFGGKKTAVISAVLSAMAALGALVPLASMVRAAQRLDAPISWLEHLHVSALGATALPNESVLYATLDGRKLYVDIYLPTRRATAAPTVFMMHGGGFMLGSRSDNRNGDRWLAQRGYAVFDVDYRLAPPLSWNSAAQDVACAMAWVQAHAETYHVLADRVLMAGQSAGGSLALQVAYGLGDGTVVSSCGGSVPQPMAVIAMYPADDFALSWNEDSKIGPVRARNVNVAYLGGSPEQFPDRYRATSSIFHVRPGLPATFIGYGADDHLVPINGHVRLAAKLREAGVANTTLVIPYSEHGYDVLWGSLGGQITRQVLGEFLARYFPAQ